MGTGKKHLTTLGSGEMRGYKAEGRTEKNKELVTNPNKRAWDSAKWEYGIVAKITGGEQKSGRNNQMIDPAELSRYKRLYKITVAP